MERLKSNHPYQAFKEEMVSLDISETFDNIASLKSIIILKYTPGEVVRSSIGSSTRYPKYHKGSSGCMLTQPFLSLNLKLMKKTMVLTIFQLFERKVLQEKGNMAYDAI